MNQVSLVEAVEFRDDAQRNYQECLKSCESQSLLEKYPTIEFALAHVSEWKGLDGGSAQTMTDAVAMSIGFAIQNVISNRLKYQYGISKDRNPSGRAFGNVVCVDGKATVEAFGEEEYQFSDTLPFAWIFTGALAFDAKDWVDDAVIQSILASVVDSVDERYDITQKVLVRWEKEGSMPFELITGLPAQHIPDAENLKLQ